MLRPVACVGAYEGSKGLKRISLCWFAYRLQVMGRPELSFGPGFIESLKQWCDLVCVGVD